MHAIPALISVVISAMAIHCTPLTQPKNGIIPLFDPAETETLIRRENAPKPPLDSCQRFELTRPMTQGNENNLISTINEYLYIAKLYGDDVKEYCHTISTAFELGCNKRKLVDLIAGPSGMVSGVCVVEWRLRFNSFDPVSWGPACLSAVMKRCYGREGGMPSCVCSCVSSHRYHHKASATLSKRDTTKLTLTDARRSI